MGLHQRLHPLGSGVELDDRSAFVTCDDALGRRFEDGTGALIALPEAFGRDEVNGWILGQNGGSFWASEAGWRSSTRSASNRITPRFYGGDAEFYAVPVKSPAGWTQVHILDPDGAWITVTDRYFFSAGAISQDAIAQLVAVNPWLAL